MIKAVIFDVGGVLIEDPMPAMISHYSAELGISEESFKAAFEEEVSDWQKGKVSEMEFWARITNKLNCKQAPPDLWLEGLKSYFKPYEKVKKLISILKSNSLKLAMLSNTEKPVADFLQKNFTDFDVYVFSCSSGFFKPEREIYEETLKELQVEAFEALFVDDRQENVDGAKNLGINAVLFEGEEKLEETLRSYGLI